MVVRLSILSLMLLSALAVKGEGMENIVYLPGDNVHDDFQFMDHKGNYWGDDIYNHHLWKWDGFSFRSFPVPVPYKNAVRRRGLLEDTRNRIWIYAAAQHTQPEIYVFDPAAETFTIYEDLKKACSVELMRFPDLEFKPQKHPKLHMRNGKAAFIYQAATNSICYYDGSKWHEFPRTRFTDHFYTEKEEHVRLKLNGELIYNIYKVKGYQGYRIEWVYSPTESWGETTHRFERPASRYIPTPPMDFRPYCTRWRALSKQDMEGDWWLFNNTNLYRHAFGKTVQFNNQPIRLASHPKRPDWIPDTMWYAHIDINGNRIFRVSNPCRIFVAMAGENPPEAQVEYAGTVDFESVFYLKFSWQLHTFVWRLDSSDWSIRNSSRLKLEGLPPGNHKLEVYAIDNKLNRCKTPTAVDFTIEGTIEEQTKELLNTAKHENVELADRANRILSERGYDPAKEKNRILARRDLDKLVQQLQSNDYDKRNEAALILSNGDKETRQRLENLLKTADEQSAWWLKAILQKMES